MDQLKEFLRQAVKYRFWIAVGVASVLFLAAYFSGTGTLAKEEKEGADKARAALKDVGGFATTPVKNRPWTQTVEEKTSVLAEDVNAAWRKLYERQAPLLDWPRPVAKYFEEWGEAYPKLDPNTINQVIIEYGQAYPDYVKAVYDCFKPFNVEDGTGIVAAPPMKLLLRPMPPFEENDLPSVNDIWAAQRKLWIQRTMLEVIAAVNDKAKAKDWDGATIKQLKMLEIANPLAVDQKTVAQGKDTLEEAAPIAPEGAAAAPAKDATAAPAGRPSSGKFAGGGGGDADGGMGLGGASALSDDTLGFVQSPNPNQYYIVPVAMTVYIEQDRIPDLLVAFKNSPMSITVKDFEMTRPRVPVRKPRKGQSAGAFAGLMGGGSRGMMMGGRGRGMDEMLGADMLGGGGGAGASMDSDDYASGGGSAGGYMKSMKNYKGTGINPGMGNKRKASGTNKETAKDVSADNLSKLKKAAKDKEKDKSKKDEAEKVDEEVAESSLSNPYFNVVEVTIRGQARFYKVPPKAPEAAPASPGAPAEAPKPDATKDEPAKVEAKPDAEPAKTDAPKPDPAKPDAPKTEAPKAEAPKTDAPAEKPAPAEPPKADAPKTEAPKAEPPKTDVPKPEGDAPKDAPATPKA